MHERAQRPRRPQPRRARRARRCSRSSRCGATARRPTPQNLAVFHDDETLEGPHLERVLGWTLFFAAIIAVALPVYWLREPNRQHESVHYFDEGAVEPRRDVVREQPDAGVRPGEVAPVRELPRHRSRWRFDAASRTPSRTSTGAFVDWRAPALNTVLQRFSPQEVNDIITFGRPGTPMQAWGVLGGGPKNEQSINDLVAYITSRQLSPKQATRSSRTTALADVGERAGSSS